VQNKHIGYFSIEKGTMNCASKGENLIVMNNPVEMKGSVQNILKSNIPKCGKYIARR
jgi:hypothetical protein